LLRRESCREITEDKKEVLGGEDKEEGQRGFAEKSVKE